MLNDLAELRRSEIRPSRWGSRLERAGAEGKRGEERPLVLRGKVKAYQRPGCDVVQLPENKEGFLPVGPW